MFRKHAELLEHASRYSRTERLAFHRDLAIRLFDATTFAASIPPVISLWPYGLDTTAGLVAAVARNAEATDFNEIIDLPIGPCLGWRPRFPPSRECR